MKLHPASIFFLLALVACSGRVKKDTAVAYSAKDGSSPEQELIFNNTKIKVEKIKTCSYPGKDPLHEKRKNKKLIVLEVSVTKLNGAQKEDMIPQGALITDSRENIYESSPGIIAITQSSGCISGDDLREYNSIWNGAIKTGETITAFVLGFEIPEEVSAEKLYWNNRWATAQQFIQLNKNNYPVVNR